MNILCLVIQSDTGHSHLRNGWNWVCRFILNHHETFLVEFLHSVDFLLVRGGVPAQMIF